MSPEMREVVAYRLQESAQSINDAQTLIELGSLRSAINRLYYACFYAVSALLLQSGLYSRKHSGVRSLFIEHYVKPGLLPQHFSTFYSGLLKTRQDLDYKDFSAIDKAEALQMQETATEFIQTICQYLENLMKEQES